MRRVSCLSILAVLICVSLAIGGSQLWTRRGPLARATTVEIRPGASLASAARALEARGAIGSARAFTLLGRLLGGATPIRAGEYRLPARASQAEILDLLQGGRTLQRLVTVPEGWPSVMVRDALNRAAGLNGSVAVPEEGSILPDSYAFESGEQRKAVVARMQQAMASYLATAWSRRKPGIAVNSPRAALILASIVEKETGKPAERRLVAAVYGNRLRRGMPLQADPTVIYPVTHGRPLGRRIRRSELDAANGYNTYARRGLPIGPIANPGRASIDAVLDPAHSTDLYFVADGTGGHVFATTLAQHNANVRRWFTIRHARGDR